MADNSPMYVATIAKEQSRLTFYFVAPTKEAAQQGIAARLRNSEWKQVPTQ